MFKEMSNLATLLKSAGELRRKMESIADQLRSKRVTGASGGGLVEVEANGLGEILGVKIDPTLVQRGEREMIEDLLPGAINQALSKSKELHVELARTAGEGLSLPGLEEILSKIIPK
jgi:DNA-binding YbaB/EbfC family protein